MKKWAHRDDSNKCSNTGFGEEMGILEIKIHTLSGALEPLSLYCRGHGELGSGHLQGDGPVDRP